MRNRFFNRELAGGALLDIGVYAISLVRSFMESCPDPVSYTHLDVYKRQYVHRYPYGKHELFHLSEDPGETTNLYGEPEYEETILDLKCRMEKWFQEYTNPELDGTKEGVTGSGQLCRAGIYAVRTDGYAPVGT